MNSVLALFGHIMQPLDICVEQIAYTCDPLVLGNTLYAGVKMVAYFNGSFSAASRDQKVLEIVRER
jgi:hypothetical protein